MQYSSKVMEHLMNPRNVGELENANAVGMVGNAKCGDIMQMFMVIDDNEVIQEVTFKTFGCGAAIATSSMATELVKGQTIKEALALTNTAVMEALDGLPPVKVHCSVLAEEAIRAALADYYTRKGIDPTPIVGEIKPFGEDDDDHHHDIPEEE
ncbi:MAG: Fe-S cluster assembly scaffold protein NifU [Clostridia bacterium]|nr:Fe-S cluster assembly scaffold protein NifU [Clostridia bacterium]